MSTNRTGTEIDKWEFYDILSAHFNRLKGELYNIIEASNSDKQQCKALKGLIKGFCNSHYKETIDEIESFLRRLEIDMEWDKDHEKGWKPHEPEPLEKIKS